MLTEVQVTVMNAYYPLLRVSSGCMEAVALNKLLQANSSLVLLLQQEWSLVFLFGIVIYQELRHGEDMSTDSHLVSGGLELHKVPAALFPAKA